MLATNAQTKKKEGLLRIVNNLLSRCDTIHDFTGERAKKVMSVYNIDNIYQYLNRTKDLQDKTIIDGFREEGIVESRIIDDLKLIMRRKDNPNFNFLQSYKNGVDERSCGYEPSVVQFFEHLLGPYDMLDPFYLLESDEVKKNCLIDYTEIDPGQIKSMDFILGKICVMELGNVEKPLADEEDLARPASGIWLNDQNLSQFRNDLTNFFVGTASDRKKLRFVIDASIVSNDTFHDETDIEDGIKVALLACSEWDSATKFSKGIVVPSEFYTSSSDVTDRVLYGLQSLYAESSAKSLVVLFNSNVVAGLDKIPREVGNIVHTLVEGMKATGPKPEAFRILQKTIEPTTIDGNVELEGVFFDIKRSGDGCQVIQIKQMNALPNASEKYVLVTNDHLAFLKARLNAVPVIFTKRNTITGNKRLFLINDTEKGSLEAQAHNLIECVEKERDGLQQFLSGIREVDMASVFDAIIADFDILKEDMLVRFFGDSKVEDAVFENMVLGAITKNPETAAWLTEQQQKDLQYVSMRMKAYLYDFLAVSIDLKTRKAMMARTFEQYRLLVENAGQCLRECKQLELQPAPPYDQIVQMCRRTLGSFSLIKTRGYGRILYEWTMEDGIEDILQDKFNSIRQVLNGNNPLSLITSKHFLLQDPVQVQNALNFRPIKVYNDIWRFLNTSYKSLSLSEITPRVSRRSAKTTVDEIGNPKSGSSVFLAKAKAFVERVYSDLRSGTGIPAELRNLLEEVCGMDEFYKVLIMEDTAQNFSLRMVDAGYVSEWLSTNSIRPLYYDNQVSAGGGYDSAYAMVGNQADAIDESRYETIHFDHPTMSENRISRKREGNSDRFYNAYQRDAKRLELSAPSYRDAFEELQEILYTDFLECFYGRSAEAGIFSSVGEFLRLERELEANLQRFEVSPTIFDGQSAESAIDEILGNVFNHAGMEGGSSMAMCDPQRLNLMADIIKHCRSVTTTNKEWRVAIKSSLRILDRNLLPHHVNETEWIRFLTKKLIVLPVKDLKLLHLRMSKV